MQGELENTITNFHVYLNLSTLEQVFSHKAPPDLLVFKLYSLENDCRGTADTLHIL